MDDSADDTFLAPEHPRTQVKGENLLLFVFMSTTLPPKIVMSHK